MNVLPGSSRRKVHSRLTTRARLDKFC